MTAEAAATEPAVRRLLAATFAAFGWLILGALAVAVIAAITSVVVAGG